MTNMTKNTTISLHYTILYHPLGHRTIVNNSSRLSTTHTLNTSINIDHVLWFPDKITNILYFLLFKNYCCLFICLSKKKKKADPIVNCIKYMTLL